MLSKRVLSAVVALPLLFAAVIIDKYIFFGALCIVTVIGMYEYFTAVKGTIKPMTLFGILSGVGLMLLFLEQDAVIYLLPAVTAIVLVSISIPVFSTKYNFLGAGATLVGVFYVSLLFGHLYMIRSIPGTGVYLVWFVFICSWLTDTFAYFTGRLFGKNRLSPVISPKKTVEGSIGGILFSTAGCIAYSIYLNSTGIISIPIGHALIIGFVSSIASQIGDLAASAIKRAVGVKDYGKIMPGHGGMLDRFDSILFVAPLIYYYIVYIL
jgi:phosphatidate cytidylyltransferase